MKNFISLFVVAVATMMISCGGNANQATTEVVETAVVETVCCDSMACDSVACDSVAACATTDCPAK